MIKLIKEIILNIDSLFKILWFSFAMCLKSKKSPSITISKKGVFWQGIFNFNIAYWIRSHLTKFCHYSLKSSNFNFHEKLTFLGEEFKLVLYLHCAAFATLLWQSKGLFYNFMFFQISQVSIIWFIPNFAHCFLDLYMRLVQKISSTWILLLKLLLC